MLVCIIMPYKFFIGYCTCENEKIKINVKYYFKTRPISIFTVIDTVDIN